LVSSLLLKFSDDRAVFANYLIGLREGLEAALIVGILFSFLIKSDRRDLIPRLWCGVVAAAGVSLAFGALLTFGPRGLSFEAQELIGGSLSIVAVGFVTVMILWMATAARSLKGGLEHRASAAMLRTGGLITVAALAIGREGLETALFVWAAARAAGDNSQPIIGATLGLITAIAIGVLVNRGAVKLDLARFFRYTGYALVVVSAGVLSYGIHDLQEAGFLPGLANVAFDISAQLPPASWYATVLRGTINLTPVTTWLQLVAWLAYIAIVGAVFFRRLHPPPAFNTPDTPTIGAVDSQPKVASS
jgi:high-affinity iron transporter